MEANENEFESSQNPINYPPPRTPLNSIPDPSQYQNEPHESSDAVRPVRSGNGSFGSGRTGKAHSEPNSAQSTPARNASRVSLGSKGRVASSCSLLKGISIANTDLCTQLPHFELKDDPSFWMDHNVQVDFVKLIFYFFYCFSYCLVMFIRVVLLCSGANKDSTVE